MGLDVGEKRIGVAVSDPLGITAQGVTVVERRGKKQELAALRTIVDQFEVTGLVLGLPRNMDGSLGVKAKEIQEYGGFLSKGLKLPVQYQDERLSTKAVEDTLITADVSRKKRRKVIDKLAAVYILQGYLDTERNKNCTRND